MKTTFEAFKILAYLVGAWIAFPVLVIVRAADIVRLTERRRSAVMSERARPQRPISNPVPVAPSTRDQPANSAPPTPEQIEAASHRRQARIAELESRVCEGTATATDIHNLNALLHSKGV